MDDDNNDVPRVTRARTRRLSTLDTESRPLTPLLDATAERASPRPMRRTRLNSATTDLRTPTRATRASLARGETPEPITPSAVSHKRATRTPAKSVRKQLPLKEDAVREEEELNEDLKDVITELPKVSKADSSSARNTPTSPAFESVLTDSAERRVTRSMSKTPPVSGRKQTNNIPQPQFDANNSMEQQQTKETVAIENVQSEVLLEKETSLNKKPPKLQVKIRNTSLDTSINKETKKVVIKDEPDSQVENNKEKLNETTIEDIFQVNKANSLEETGNNSQAERKATPNGKKEKSEDKDVFQDVDKDSSLEKADSSAEYQSPESNQDVENNKNNKVASIQEQNKEAALKQGEDAVEISGVELMDVDMDASMEQLTMPPTNSRSTIAKIVEDVRLPDLTPKTLSRVMDEKTDVDASKDSKRKVDFHGNDETENEEKTKYPKTPARLHTPTTISMLKQDQDQKEATPLKPMILKGRNSSTPLAKPESVLLADELESMVKQTPPQQIDVIKSLSDLESKDALHPEMHLNKQKKLTSRLVSEDEDEEEDEDEDEDQAGICEFFDNEVEVIDNYQSGDSMDSSERREIEENQVPHDGESVGSQDTIEEHSEDDEFGSLSSFIVSDNDDDDKDKDQDQDNDDDDEIGDLCFSSDVESVKSDAKSAKKRRRIVVQDSSDEEDLKEKTVDKSTDKNKSGKEVTSKNDSKAVLNKTESASPHDTLEKIEVSSSSDEEEEEHEIVRNKFSKSIYEVSDSDSDDVDKTTNLSKQLAEETKQIKDTSILKEDIPNLASDSEPVVKATVKANSKSSSFHQKQKREDEAALLADLPSGDLSHLQQMFNPLQKSRRQTLYVQGPENSDLPAKPKLKRRSEQLNSDVQPSQSFIETLAEQKSQRLKRKKSKSFCGTADDLDTTAVQDVQCKKPKKSINEAEIKMDVDQSKKAKKSINEAEIKIDLDQSKKAKKSINEAEIKIDLDQSKKPKKSINEAETKMDVDQSKKPKKSINESEISVEVEQSKKPKKSINEAEMIMDVDQNKKPKKSINEAEMTKEVDQSKKPKKSINETEITVELYQSKKPKKSINEAETKMEVDQSKEPKKSTNEAEMTKEVDQSKKPKKSINESDINMDVDQSKKLKKSINEAEITVEVDQSKKPKKSTEIEITVGVHPKKQANETKDEAEIAMTEQSDKGKSVTTNISLEKQTEAKKPKEPTKDSAYYIDYCDNILQAANEAMLEQKKQRVALGKKPKKVLRPASKTISDAMESASTLDAVAPVTLLVIEKSESEKSVKLKKDVKRLQATKQAVKHAMHLLGPDSGNKEPQSLARKLSPQPQMNAKGAKETKQTKRKKQKVVVSPVKSSDEENHHAIKRIKTSAGYVEVSEVSTSSSSSKNRIELIKTRSGIMKVEPCTPTQKYFKEVPLTPHSRSGLGEVSKAAKKKLVTGANNNVIRNPATESALRFKQQIYGRPPK